MMHTEIEPKFLHYEIGTEVAWWAIEQPPEEEVFHLTYRPDDPAYGYMQYEARVLGTEPVSEASPDVVPDGATPDMQLVKLQMIRQ